MLVLVQGDDPGVTALVIRAPPSPGCEQRPHQSNNHSLDMVLVLAQGDDPGVATLGLTLTLGIVRDDL